MGANSVNTMGEKLKVIVEKLTDGVAIGSIITNGFPKSLTKCSVKIPVSSFGNDKISSENSVKRFMEIASWAENDPLRAVTHNKGIMNGISAVSMAFGNDLRALESAAHFHASIPGKYSPLSKWRISKNKDFVEGTLELPLPLGTVGGMTSFHPVVSILLEKLKIRNSSFLKSMVISAGLANNFAALLAIATTGIQKGHMKLHKRKNRK